MLSSTFITAAMLLFSSCHGKRPTSPSICKWVKNMKTEFCSKEYKAAHGNGFCSLYKSLFKNECGQKTLIN